MNLNVINATGTAATAAIERLPQLHARNVVAFLDDGDTATTLRDLCRDSLATPPRVQGGGLGAALEHHDLIGDVETILVDTDSSLMPTADIAALRTVISDEVRIVTIGAADGTRSEAELLAAGADRHLHKPVDAEDLAGELFEEISSGSEPEPAGELAAPRRPAAATPEIEKAPQPQAPVGAPRRIVVLGAHSGVGGTSLAVNLAALIGRGGDDTLLIDLDLQFGTALLLLNRQPSSALVGMLREPGRIDATMLRNTAQEAGGNLAVLGAEEPLAFTAPMSEEAGTALMREAGAAFHNLVVDLPAHRLDLLAPCLAAATDIVLVSDFTLAGVRDVWRMQYEIERHAPAEARRHLVIGGAVDAGDRVMTQGEFEHNTGMKIAARLPHDAAASGQASAAGKPVALAKPRSRIGKAYAKFARGFMPAPAKRGFSLFGPRRS